MIADTIVEPLGVYPAQCSCGHLYLEKYQWATVTPQGYIGFCWCGFCRKRFNVKPTVQAEAA